MSNPTSVMNTSARTPVVFRAGGQRILQGGAVRTDPSAIAIWRRNGAGVDGNRTHLEPV